MSDFSASDIRLAIIGLGPWGKNFVSSISDVPGVTLSYVVSSNPDNISYLPSQTSLVHDYHKILDPKIIEGAIITTPPSTHASIAKDLLDHDLSIVIEKPLTLSFQDAEKLMVLAEQKPVSVFVDNTYLFNPAFRAFKSLLSRYGPIQKITTLSGKWVRSQKETPVLWDWAPHDIAMCIDILKSFPNDMSMCSTPPIHHHPYAESLSINLQFDTIPVHIQISNALSQKTRLFQVETTHHMIVFRDYSTQAIQVFDKQTSSYEKESFSYERTRPLTILIQEFSQAVANHQHDISHLKLGMDVVQILSQLDALKKATSSNKGSNTKRLDLY